MDANDIIAIVDHVVQSKLHTLIVTFVITATVLLLLKQIAEALTGYIQFRLDQHVGIGTPVEVYGLRGRIKETSIFTITIETKDCFIRVPTKEWRFSQYRVLRDTVLCDDICKEEKK